MLLMADQSGYVTIKDEIYLSNDVLVELIRDVLSKGKTFRFCGKGWSMSPFIQDGDVISIVPIVESSPKVGEVVAYTLPDTEKLIVHRIISIDRDEFHLQGDNQSSDMDDVIQLSNILGRVSRIERDGKCIRIGLGPEKRLIALFSQRHLLQPVLVRLASLFRPFRRVLE